MEGVVILVILLLAIAVVAASVLPGPFGWLVALLAILAALAVAYRASKRRGRGAV